MRTQGGFTDVQKIISQGWPSSSIASRRSRTRSCPQQILSVATHVLRALRVLVTWPTIANRISTLNKKCKCVLEAPSCLGASKLSVIRVCGKWKRKQSWRRAKGRVCPRSCSRFVTKPRSLCGRLTTSGEHWQSHHEMMRNYTKLRLTIFNIYGQ